MTPAGVPVEMMSPFSRVITLLNLDTISGIFMNILFVDEFCLISPLILVVNFKFCGSLISSAVVIHGPDGANVSKLFPLVNCLSLN